MISFICSAYNRPQHLKVLAHSLIVQTNPDWELLVMDESEERINDISKLDPRITHYPCNNFNDFGYSVKENGIKLAYGDYLCFPADDVYYAPTFVEVMSKKASKGFELVYCNWIHDRANYSPVQVLPAVGYIDVGGFIIKKHLMTGFPDKGHEGDGKLIEELVKTCKHSPVEQYLYVKN